MRRVFTMIAVIVLAGCGSSSGPDPSTWLGTWSVQVTNGSGWHVNPLQYHLTLVDSANDMWATVPAVSVTDDNNTDPVNFSQFTGVRNYAVSADSVWLGVSAQGTNSGLTYNLLIQGTRAGTSAAGSLTLDLQGGGGSSVVATWTAAKQ